ncbi:hypothetical protein [Alicyclobacillus fodiniaquatilis]|uniref:N-acetyltransferase domain-containing protein n=1 Tax=Alicyclobacillus fodiniaquatilis TaxID=1661150 RepID=A0ABW4JK48_9BACL
MGRAFHVRPLSGNDDYGAVLKLLNQTIRIYHPSTPMSFGGHTPALLREQYFENNAGFLALKGREIVAFMGVRFPKERQEASLVCGFIDTDASILESLLHLCMDAVQGQGRSRIVLREYINFGQIRSPMITLWERLGFIPDEYIYTSTNMNLWKWDPPTELDTSRIEHNPALELSDIHQILLANDPLDAELFRKQYLSDGESGAPDHVILTLKEPGSDEIQGIASYKVIYKYDEYNALAFGLIFKPESPVDKSDKRRLLQTALVSMKELNIHRVVSRISFKDPEIFWAMAAEGFNSITAQVHSVNLTKFLD